MRKFIIIITILLAASCTIEKTGPLIQDPEYSSSSLIYQNVVEPLIHVGELVYFFDEYQKIRDDREKGLALYKSMFGDLGKDNLLSFETVNAEMLGKVVLQKEGYLAYPYKNDSFKLTVDTDGKQNFIFSSSDKDITVVNYQMTVSDGEISTIMDFSFVDKGGTSVFVTTEFPLVKKIADGKTYCTPERGGLKIQIKGQNADDSFLLSFNGPFISMTGGIAGGDYDAFFTEHPLFKRYESK